MLYLRETFFHPEHGPMTMVIAEDSLKKEIHVQANEDRGLYPQSVVDIEIFTWTDNFETAVFEGQRRSEKRIPEEEVNRNTLYYWLIANFIQIKPEAVIMSHLPAPLSTQEMKFILEQAAKHKSYRNHTVRVTSKEGDSIVLGNGSIVVRDAP